LQRRSARLVAVVHGSVGELLLFNLRNELAELVALTVDSLAGPIDVDEIGLLEQSLARREDALRLLIVVLQNGHSCLCFGFVLVNVVLASVVEVFLGLIHSEGTTVIVKLLLVANVYDNSVSTLFLGFLCLLVYLSRTNANFLLKLRIISIARVATEKIS